MLSLSKRFKVKFVFNCWTKQDLMRIVCFVVFFLTKIIKSCGRVNSNIPSYFIRLPWWYKNKRSNNESHWVSLESWACDLKQEGQRSEVVGESEPIKLNLVFLLTHSLIYIYNTIQLNFTEMLFVYRQTIQQ